MIYIGIDGGPKGGIVALSPVAGLEPIMTAPMPTIKRDGVVLVDGKAVASLLRALPWPTDGLHVTVEGLLHHSKSSSAMRSMALNFGRLSGALEARLESDRVRIAYVPPGTSLQSWQRVMLDKVTAKEQGTKAAALKAAGEIWPGFNWTEPRCKVPHDGVIDAALLAEFSRRKGEAWLAKQGGRP